MVFGHVSAVQLSHLARSDKVRGRYRQCLRSWDVEVWPLLVGPAASDECYFCIFLELERCRNTCAGCRGLLIDGVAW